MKGFRGNLRNFAAVKTTRRQISAFFLLAVFLPMLLLSSLHIHESTENGEATFTECLHNHCGGHLTQITTHLHDCVLCQLLTLPVLTAVLLAVMVYVRVCKKFHAQPFCGYHSACCGAIVTRGPPSF